MQNGSIMRSERRRGPDVWEYRWREPGADGRGKHRRMVVGSVIPFRDKDAAVRAISASRRDINMENARSKGNLQWDEEVTGENIVVKVTERRWRMKLPGRDPSVRIGPLPADGRDALNRLFKVL